MIKITDTSTRFELRACCEFDFKGFVISLSTVFPTSSDRVAVFKEGRRILTCFTVEEAVQAIDSYTEDEPGFEEDADEELP